VLAGTSTFEYFKTVAWRYSQISKSSSNLKLSKLSSCHVGNVRETPYITTF